MLILLLVPVGCIKTTKRLPADQRMLPAKTATRSDLFKDLEAKSKQVQTLKGSMNIEVSGGGPKSGVVTEYHETRGAIVVERPNNIRVQVQLPLVSTTVANMVSDGRQYRVYLPLEKQYMVGDVDAPPSAANTIKDLRPQQFMAGLFVDIRQYLENPQVKSTFEESSEGVRSFYVFSFIDVGGAEARTLEKIWIDRLDLQVGRKQVFGKDGRIEVDARYSDYKPMNGVPFPQSVVLQLPLQDYTVKMTFQNATINEAVPDNAFTLPQPDGAKLVQVSKGSIPSQ